MLPRRVCANFKSADCVDAKKIMLLHIALIIFVLVYDFIFSHMH